MAVRLTWMCRISFDLGLVSAHPSSHIKGENRPVFEFLS